MKELGLTALGHRMRLRDYCSKRKKVGSDENERKEKLEKLRALIEASAQSKSKRQTVKDTATTKSNSYASSLGGNTGLMEDLNKRK